MLRADIVGKEAATITAVFPSPNDVMSILVQVFLHESLLLASDMSWLSDFHSAI